MTWEELSHFTWEELKDTTWEDVYEDKIELLKKYEQSKIPLTKEALEKLNEICGKLPKEVKPKDKILTKENLSKCILLIIKYYPNAKEIINDLINLLHQNYPFDSTHLLFFLIYSFFLLLLLLLSQKNQKLNLYKTQEKYLYT